ncbi:MAG: CoA-binding protein, partial [Syntrophales bacterium]|nr:CoA-binding protein [Syntrophales bacterium]
MSLDRLFYPNSVAVIGASASLGGGKIPYFHVIKGAGFQGSIYPVNPRHKEINGTPAFSSIDDLPDGIDLTIVAAPLRQSVDIIRSAARKKFKFVHFFTSGFGESGNREMEEELLREARAGGVRIIGPNCIGVHCSESRVNFGYIPREEPPGPSAFLGQSGGITANFMSMATTRKIPVNKVVSYGNQIDVAAEDFLDYFARDDSIRIIACYIEDIKEPARFLSVLKYATEKKPVIILKGGKTDQGSKAAASHTGALAGDYKIWSSAMRQHGAILVDDFDQLMNLVMLGTTERLPEGRRVGFLGAGGGVSVLFADLAVKAGLLLPELEDRTQKLIMEKIRDINTSTTNPVDLGAYGFDLAVMLHTMKAFDNDDGIDFIIPSFSVAYIAQAELFLNVKNNEQTILEMA